MNGPKKVILRPCSSLAIVISIIIALNYEAEL